MSLGRFLAARILQALVVLALVTTVVFALVRLAPGEPFAYEDPRVTPAMRAELRRQFGYDQAVPVQLARYVANVARGNLGWSHGHGRPVRAVLADALPRTMLLTGVALGVALFAGVAIGAWQASRVGTRRESVTSLTLVTLYSVPDFWLALLALLAFAYWLPVFPAGGMVDVVMHDYMTPSARIADRLRHLVLPAATLALLTTAAIARFQRAAVLEVLPLDFVRTARAKGLDERAIVWRHALRNALLPTVTLLGVMLPALVGGAVFVEKVFSWPGMGLVTVNAITTRDYALITGAVIVGAAAVAVGSLLADLLYVALDPRVRLR